MDKVTANENYGRVGDAARVELLDHGYVELVETWGSDERIVEAARMSTGKGFKGWGGAPCPACDAAGRLSEHDRLFRSHEKAEEAREVCECKGTGQTAGDERLLRFLWENRHATPFEMAGATFEIKAPIMVFREWHRHRTQCLAPDTLVHFEAPKSDTLGRRSVYKMRIEDIWRKWQPTTHSDRPERQTNALRPRSRIQSMRLRCLDEERREFVTTRIVDVIRGEPKRMLKVTTASGRSFVASREHRVLTNEGWACLGDALGNGALLTLEGTSRGLALRWEVPKAQRPEEWRPIVGWEDTYQVSSHGRVRRIGCEPKRPTVVQGYDVVSLNRPGEQTTRTVHTLVLESFEGSSTTRETRHLDNNRANNSIDNLKWGSPLENAGDRVDADRQQRLVPVFENVVSVKEMGEVPSFDLSVAGPWHNFAADGFVVHNSYNEMSARYTPLPDENYVPTVERLMVGSDGKNRQAGTVAGAGVLTREKAERFRQRLRIVYEGQQSLYEDALAEGVPKELARVHLPVGRYSRMRASANLRNWLAFLSLRMAPNAQWEIRQFANAVHDLLAPAFGRTLALFDERKAA